MKLDNIVEGINILKKYMEFPDSPNHSGADRGRIFVYGANKYMERADVEKLIDLGWLQENHKITPFIADEYKQDESWFIWV